MSYLPITDPGADRVRFWDDSAGNIGYLTPAGGVSISGTQLFAELGGPEGGVVSGGQVVWTSGYSFKVTAATYYIGGVLYTSIEQTVTLAAADGTFDRIDLVVLDDTGTADKVTGTAAALPSEPDFDPATQVRLSFVIVPTGTTQPEEVTNENIYLENTEWTTATSGTGFTASSAVDPFAGTVSVEGTNVANRAEISFAKGSSLFSDDYSLLTLVIKSKATWAKRDTLRFFWETGGVATGGAVSLKEGLYGFLTSNTSTYQQIGIPIPDFNLPAGGTFDKLIIQTAGTAFGFYIDNIVLQARGTSLSTVAGTNTLSIADLDLRYERIADRVDVLVIAVSDETTALTTGTAKVTFRMPYAFTVSDVRSSVTTAPTGAALVVDINDGGTTILSTKLSIDAGEDTSTTAATPAVISDTALASDAKITIDIDAVGSTIAGAGLKVALIGKRA
jgi:hypothetical protein